MSKELKLLGIKTEAMYSDIKYAAVTTDVGKKLLEAGWVEIAFNKYPTILFSATADVREVTGHRDFADYANLGFRASIQEAIELKRSIDNRREYKRTQESVKETPEITDKVLLGQEPYPIIEKYPNRPSQLVMAEYLKHHIKSGVEQGLFEHCSVISYIMTAEKFIYALYAEFCLKVGLIPLDEQKAWWKAIVMYSPQKLQVIVAETQKPLIGDRIWEEIESDGTIHICKGLCEALTEEDAILQSTSWAKEFFML